MNSNDPRIIIYIHNEMSPDERNVFEQEMAQNPELRQAVDEMKEFSALLDEGFSFEPEETLTDSSREVILEQADKTDKKKNKRKPFYFLLSTIVHAAACVAIVMIWHKTRSDNQYPSIKRGATEVNLVMENLEEDKVCVEELEQCDVEISPVSALKAQPLKAPFGVSRKLSRRKHVQVFVEDDVFFNTEEYDSITPDNYVRVADEPLSTFSIDVDTASYSNVRRMLNQGALPPKGAVRIEEMINYFNYDYKAPRDDKPFAVDLEMAQCPWDQKHRLVRIGLKGKEISSEKREAANLVFLLDVSGSMSSANKLPLLKKSLKMLVNNLKAKDRVAIVVYAGASGLVLPSTSCEERGKILESLDRLAAGGSTNGGAGIELAYKTAVANYIEKGINRVILCTDGDFNVGTTNQSELVDKIEKSAKTGVYLSVFGFGMGNYKDSTLEKLADKGNGNYGYIDTEKEAKKALVEQVNGTLVTIAKDVKIQVEFNPAQVKAYRLIGYENRKLDKQDFNDDKKDAGEIGAGHTVTAFYEVIMAKDNFEGPSVDPLKYQQHTKVKADLTSEVLTVKVRYKKPDEDKSQLLEFPLQGQIGEAGNGSDDLRFAAGVSAFGMLLRDSKFKGSATYDMVLELCGAQDRELRKEFIELVNKAKRLTILK